jgi:integrase
VLFRSDMHLIGRLHAVIAKLPKNTEIEGVPTLHRFRRTYASMMIAHTDLQTVQKLMGHSDIQTTARYLAADLEKARQGTRTAFKGVGD